MDGTRNILLVEDNPDDLELALRAFRKINMPETVAVARDGAEAVDYMSTVAVLPCLVLLDLQLPKLHGLEVLRHVRANRRSRRVPVVMLTSSNEDSDIRTSYELGANSFVRKPVDYSKFVETARILRAYWLQINEMPPG